MYNRAILIGRLTADPELRKTISGLSVCSFTIAVNRRFSKDETDFLEICAWRQTAEFVSKYFAKGRLIGVEGSIQAENWTDKQGVKRRRWQVVADGAFFCDSKDKTSPASAGPGCFEEIEPPDDMPY